MIRITVLDFLNCYGRLDQELSEQFNSEKYSRFACNYMTIKENAKCPIGFTKTHTSRRLNTNNCEAKEYLLECDLVVKEFV